MRRHAFLAALHELLQPRRYLEIGVNRGESMRLSRAASIGIDPAYSVTSEIRCDVHLARTTSDEFFAREDALHHFDEPNADLAFIDGLHYSEFALRDFLNVERVCLPTSVIVIDDTNPRSVEEAARYRLSTLWAGDVFKVVGVLREHRPDLTVIEVNTEGTGVAVVLGADPADRVLPRLYDEIAVDLCTPDPQDLPACTLDRTRAVSPVDLLSHPVWAVLREMRGRQPTREQVRAELDRLALPGGTDHLDVATA